MKHIGELIAEQIGQNSKVEGHNYSAKLWDSQRVNGVPEVVTTEQEKKYWESVYNIEPRTFTDFEQQQMFFQAYRQVLGVGKEISESDYLEKSKNDLELVDAIKCILNWYFKAKEFKKGGFFIYSTPGVGKTKMVKALSLLSKYVANSKNMGRIEFCDIARMIGKHNTGDHQDFSFLTNENLIIDDLSERVNNVQSFGYKYSLAEIFENRYNVWQSNGKGTVITTNIFPFKSEVVMSLQEIVGDRAMDRIKQQYEIILLTGESKRK